MTFLLWFVQFACEIGLTVRLRHPAQRLFRVLIGYAAVTDLVGGLAYGATTRYFYIYWILRIIELNLAVAATCYLLHHMFPGWRWGVWTPLGWTLAVTIINWVPYSNRQMCFWETFMFFSLSAIAWFAVIVGAGLRLRYVALAAALAFTLQLACVVIWRSWGYAADIWMITWITGMLMLWWTSRDSVQPPEDQHT